MKTKHTKNQLLNIVRDIQDLLSGKQWDADTVVNIADILTHEGFEIKEPE